MKTFLKPLLEGKTLDQHDAETAMGIMLSGEASPEQVGALLAAVQVRGETKAEMLGFLAALESRATRVELSSETPFDTCGTGGDGSQTFNISTATALLLAANGLNVAKHGNRSVSSLSGSADVLEKLGIPIDLSPKDVADAIDTKGFGFLFAPTYHPALKTIGPIRRALGARTVFHLLGPIANPARIKRRIVGLFDIQRLTLIAEVLRSRGEEEAMVVASLDGMDEISLSSPTRIAHLKNGDISLYEVKPEDFGVVSAPLTALRGADAQTNAHIIEKVLCGELTGPCLDVVLINAAAALKVAGRVADLKEGVRMASGSILSGNAEAVLASLGRVGNA